MNDDDKHRLESLPWHIQLEEWEENGVELLIVRRGDSRHPVVFVERQGYRYAIKETTPRMAEREIRNLQEIEQRDIPTLNPIGTVLVAAPPIAIDVPGLKGMRQYINSDRGYTVTRLAPRVVPHVILYRLPLTRRTKQRMLSAVAILMAQLHEKGVYWGDPSLANALLRIDGPVILAIMADAETVELFPDPLSEGMREQDLAQFGESLAWQAEDLRQAKGLPEDTQVLNDADYRYFCRRYRTIHRQQNHNLGAEVNEMLAQNPHLFQTMGDTLREKTRQTVQQVSAIFPGWYQQRIYELIHITIPQQYARRFYNLILGHQAIMQKNEEREVAIEEAAHDWYRRYHLPAILLLRQRLTAEQDPMRAYFAIMQHKWDMSVKAGYEIPLDDAIHDWSKNATRGGAINPARKFMALWRQRKPETASLEQTLLESEEFDPLLSTAERPLVRLAPPELEQQLPRFLDESTDEDTP
ncbi:MAG TPA: DUF4032 domain-containing protein [Dictyobacter sp.]|jgi:hypothetical protein|nr:DUF4032 domain-containing protein [Dictyobacter sp.]